MKLFLIAGEASGDALGAALMAGLKSLAPEVEFHGVGGPKMAAEGLQSLFPMEELSVMGLVEILRWKRCPIYGWLSTSLAAAGTVRLSPSEAGSERVLWKTAPQRWR